MKFDSIFLFIEIWERYSIKTERNGEKKQLQFTLPTGYWFQWLSEIM